MVKKLLQVPLVVTYNPREIAMKMAKKNEPINNSKDLASFRR